MRKCTHFRNPSTCVFSFDSRILDAERPKALPFMKGLTLRQPWEQINPFTLFVCGYVSSVSVEDSRGGGSIGTGQKRRISIRDT